MNERTSNPPQDIHKQIADIQSPTNSAHKHVSHTTIFHEILASKLPASEKSATRLWQDGQVTVIAGTLTTAWALSVTTFHLLTLPDVLRTLKAELAAAMPDPAVAPPLATLEQLPYLTAVIQEGLRLSCGVSSRLSRIAPDEDLVFADAAAGAGRAWTIPRGTPVGMTSLLAHYDAACFPAPTEFRPQRFVAEPRLDRFLLAFSRGSRRCIGVNLAYAELYLAVARIFRRYGSVDVRGEDDVGALELYGTTARDVEIVGDGITPLVWKGSRGIRVRVVQ